MQGVRINEDARMPRLLLSEMRETSPAPDGLSGGCAVQDDEMTAILAAVSAFCVVLVILDALPKRYLTGDLGRIRVHLRPTFLRVSIASPWFLFEWLVNDRDFERDGRVSGLRLLLGCENWWARKRGDAIYYRRVIVDSREYTERERAWR